MERVGRTAHVSLRYGISQRSFESEASSSDMKTPDNDVDFDDVFGGPPTRTRYSFGGGRIKSSDESTSSPVGLGERPVFGESYSSPRKRTSDDFYDDIFRRSDESVRSPRWSSTTPGSRTLSPTNPKIEPFSNSIPTEFSLPAKMAKDVDIPVFCSNAHTSTTILSRFSSPTVQGRDVFGNHQGQSPGQTLLSRESSGVKYSTQSTQNDEIGHKSNPRTGRSGSPSSEFHFSIHKWANVGVPLLMSLRGSKHPMLKASSKVTALSMDTMQDSSFPNDELSTGKKEIHPPSETGLMEEISKETSSVKQGVKENEVITPNKKQGDEEAKRKENMEKTSGDATGKTKKLSSSKKTEANKPVMGSPKNRVKGMVKDFFKMSNQDSSPKTKKNAATGNLSSRWKTTPRNQTQEEVIPSVSKLDEMTPNSLKKTPLDSEMPAENIILAPETSTTTPLDSKKPAENVKMVPDVSTRTPLDSKKPAENVKMAPDASFMGGEGIKKPKFPQNRTIRKLEDIYFQKDASPASESVPDVSKVTVENIDDPSLDNFQVEELPCDEDKVSKSQEESEAIRGLDSKINMWSSGRKGNIRSLLSTLQLVLWADSGWKPVALVDIIEANAVKKAYNRAMLCLHPDKLQQKGADTNKKYMAEKVFDILQEAWDHFNSLGTLL